VSGRSFSEEEGTEQKDRTKLEKGKNRQARCGRKTKRIAILERNMVKEFIIPHYAINERGDGGGEGVKGENWGSLPSTKQSGGRAINTPEHEISGSLGGLRTHLYKKYRTIQKK